MTSMTHRERFLSAIQFQRPDIPALEYYYTDVGYAEHGEKLLELYRRYPGDAEPVPETGIGALPAPDPADFGPDGKYRRIETDAWGITWEYRIFGRIGHVINFPLDDMGRLEDYEFPPMPLAAPAALSALRGRVESGGEFPVIYGIPGLFERLIALRPFEKVLMDIATEEPALERLADRLTDAFTAETERVVEAGADVIKIGDDYGTGRAPLISPAAWRRFFFPRIKKILGPAVRAGRICCFHSCGQIWDILPGLKETGADSIWPQLPLYDYGALSAKLRDTGLALCIHIDRGELMQHGGPDDVKSELDRVYQAFRPDLGGSWFYFEVDQGFPFANIQALAEAIAKYRR